MRPKMLLNKKLNSCKNCKDFSNNRMYELK